MNEFERTRRNILMQNSEFVLFESGKVNLGFAAGYSDSGALGSVSITDEALIATRLYGAFSIGSSNSYNLSNFNELIVRWQQPENVGNASSEFYAPTSLSASSPIPFLFSKAGRFEMVEEVYDIAGVTGQRRILFRVGAAAALKVELSVFKIALR